MKSLKTLLAMQAPLLASGLALADVTPQPADLNTGSDWRTAANPAVEPDGQYGTAGYVLFGVNLPDNNYTASGYDIAPANGNNLYALSSFVSGVVTPPGTSYSMWSGNGNFGRIQNPAAANALTATTALLSSARPGSSCDLTVRREAGGAAFRLTVMIGLSSDGGYPNAQTTVTVNAGTAGSGTSDTSTAPNGGATGTPGMLYLSFDIGPGTDDILVQLAGPGANLTGFAIDPPATVVVPPSITRQPLGGTCLEGIPVTLSASASGTPPLTYQWFRGEAPIPDATNTTLRFPSLSSADIGSYFAVATNPGGSATSQVAVLNVAASLPQRTLAYQDAVRPTIGLLSQYQFDRMSALDALNLHPGTLVGTASFTTGPGGGADKALALDGSGHVRLGAVADFEFTSGVGTVEAWVRADWSVANPPPYNPCFFSTRNGGPTRWSIHLLQAKDQIAFWNGAGVALAPIPNAGTNWHHFASIFDNGTWRVYWDGTLIGSFALALGGSPGLTTQLGSATAGATGEGWVGALDEVAFYGAPLTTDEVIVHYSAFAGPRLTITKDFDELIIAWPSAITGFTLESAETIDAELWNPVPGVVDNSVSVPANGVAKFYRLRQP